MKVKITKELIEQCKECKYCSDLKEHIEKCLKIISYKN